MPTKRCFVAASVVFGLSCASERARRVDDDRGGLSRALIVPEGLSVSALPGGTGVLEVAALTLREGASGKELYAAVRNIGDAPACSAAFAVELFDHTGRSLAAGIGGLLTRHLYRRTDSSGAVAACVGPSDVAMAAVTELPADLQLDEVDAIVYHCPYFALEVVPVAGLTISRVESVRVGAGSAYSGTLRNELDVAVRNPSVAIFPITQVGRPLGVATGSGGVELLPGQSWDFETSAADAVGVDYAAFPAGAIDPPTQPEER